MPRHFPLRKALYIAVAVVLALALVVYPEYRARDEAERACAEVPVGARLDTDDTALARWTSERKARFGTLYVSAFHADDTAATRDRGAVMMVFLGAFPFGREICLLKLDRGTVTGKHIQFGADDHAYCRGELRLVTECS